MIIIYFHFFLQCDRKAHLVAPISMITDPCCVFICTVRHLGFYVNSETYEQPLNYSLKTVLSPLFLIWVLIFLKLRCASLWGVSPSWMADKGLLVGPLEGNTQNGVCSWHFEWHNAPVVVEDLLVFKKTVTCMYISAFTVAIKCGHFVYSGLKKKNNNPLLGHDNHLCQLNYY